MVAAHADHSPSTAIQTVVDMVAAADLMTQVDTMTQVGMMAQVDAMARMAENNTPTPSMVAVRAKIYTEAASMKNALSTAVRSPSAQKASGLKTAIYYGGKFTPAERHY